MNLFYQPRIPEGISFLDEDESRHCSKVLRKSNGDTIRITDGRGKFYEAIIEDSNPLKCLFKITDEATPPAKNHFIHIAIAPTKNIDRIEWFVEKATEVGIDKISLLETTHTERSFIKTERLTKVAVSAMKQSYKAFVPQITPLTPFGGVIANATERERYIAFVDHTNPYHLKDVAKRDQNYLVLIGPEGDFSKEELTSATEAGFIKVSLGHSRLRTETAGLIACHTLNLINQ